MSVSFVAILMVACVMALLARRLKLPYTVVLVVAGLIVSYINGAGEAGKLGIDIKTVKETIAMEMEKNRGSKNDSSLD